MRPYRALELRTFSTMKEAMEPQGRVTVNLLTMGRFGDTGARSCHLGLSAVAYGDGAAPLERVGLLEKVTLQSQLSRN